jgi:uncharacterized membrane protein YoaK (UPF0700 family)
MLLVLTGAAGCVDAISYMGLGHVFTAMMTGNTVLLGLAVGQGEVLAALRSILALLGFALGVVLGAVIVEGDQKREDWSPAVTGAFAVEAVVLGAFAAAWHVSGAESAAAIYGLIVLLGVAMGIQAAAVRRLGVPGIATTYITGTVTSLFVDLVGWIRAAALRSGITGSADPPGEAKPWEQRVGLLAAVFVAYGLGAMVGGVLQSRASPLVTVLPLVAVTLVATNAFVRYSR